MRTLSPTALAAVLLASAGPLSAQTPSTPLTLPDVVVAPSRTPIEAARSGSAVAVLTRTDLQATGAVNLVDALATLPGVAIQQTGGAGAPASIRLRGLAGSYVQVRVDGIDVSDPAGPQISAPLHLLKTAEVERVELLRGSQSALYGGQAVAGVLAINTRRATEAGLRHALTAEGGAYETLSGGYTLTGGFERGEAALTVSGFRTSGFSAADRRDGNTEKDGSSNLTVSGSGELRPTETLAFGGAFRFTEAHTDYDGFPPPAFVLADADNEERHRTWGGRAYVRHAALEGRLTNELAVQHFVSERRNDEAGTISTFDGDRTRLEWLGGAQATPRVGLQYGADWMFESAEVPGLSADTDIVGAFAQVTVEPVDRVTLTLAGRHDRHSEFGGYTSGRATAAVRATDATVLRGSLANGFRAPSLFELFAPGFGTPTLEPETSVSWDVGVDQTLLDGRVRLGLGYFDITVTDKIEYDFVSETYRQLDGRSRSRGVEATAAAQVTGWLSVQGAYTYADARNDRTGAREVRVPRHQGSVRVGVTPVERLTLSGTVNFVDDLRDGFPPRSISYAVLGAQAEWRATPEASLFLRGENLLDRQYQQLDGYGTPGLSVFAGVRAAF